MPKNMALMRLEIRLLPLCSTLSNGQARRWLLTGGKTRG